MTIQVLALKWCQDSGNLESRCYQTTAGTVSRAASQRFGSSLPSVRVALLVPWRPTKFGPMRRSRTAATRRSMRRSRLQVPGSHYLLPRRNGIQCPRRSQQCRLRAPRHRSSHTSSCGQKLILRRRLRAPRHRGQAWPSPDCPSSSPLASHVAAQKRSMEASSNLSAASAAGTSSSMEKCGASGKATRADMEGSAQEDGSRGDSSAPLLFVVAGICVSCADAFRCRPICSFMCRPFCEQHMQFSRFSNHTHQILIV